MPFPVICSCGQRFMAQEHLHGQRVPCPACGGTLLIQNPRASAASVQRLVSQTPNQLRVACACGRSYQPGPELAGRTVRCTACGNVLQVPSLPGTARVQAEPVRAMPQKPILPASMQSKKRPKRAAAVQDVDDSEQATVRFAIKMATVVCVLAILAGILFGAVIPLGKEAIAWMNSREDTEPTISEPEVTTEPEDDVSETLESSTQSVADAVDIVNPTYGPAEDGSSNPFEPDGEEFETPNPMADANVEMYGSSSDSRSTSDIFGGPSDVASSEASTERVGLTASIDKWRDQPNRDLTAIRRVSGDNYAVYAHYSWMSELLPFLGYQDVYDKFDFTKSWLNEDNLQLSGELIPEFQNPGDTRERWKGYPFDNMALTHFVGMSGVEDRRNVVAAKLPREDPRAGIFGYDEVAKREEITDGESNTIMMIGSGKLASPWVAGGGATVRGAREPYFDSLTGFGSKSTGQSGAASVMADGSVKFISSNIDPSVFRAMSTIHGNEQVDASRWMSDATLSE